MKALRIFQVLAILMIGSFAFTSCSDDDDMTTDQPQLTEDEISILQFMREEEKLARDVYTYLSELYNINIFSNISGSEQKHINFVLEVMEDYNLEDVGSSVEGEFTNPDIQILYDDLTALGSQSLIDALKVGATIEDVDIFDLRDSKTRTDKADLIDLLDLLECGSRNHIRGFTGRLSEYDVTYVPQYISQEEFDEILNGSHESCSN